MTRKTIWVKVLKNELNKNLLKAVFKKMWSNMVCLGSEIWSAKWETPWNIRIVPLNIIERFRSSYFFICFSSCITSSLRLLNAQLSGVLLSSSFMVGSAPCCSRIFTTFILLLPAAQWSGVLPKPFFTFTLASFFSRLLTTSTRLLYAAQWRAVSPCSSWVLTGTPASSISLTPLMSPKWAATTKCCGSTSRRENELALKKH